MTTASFDSQRRRHWEMLVVASVVAILAFLLDVPEDDRVVFGWLPSLPLPPLCPSYTWFGLKCPGCGLTRSIVLLAHGDLAGSWRLHHVGFVMAAAILLQFPYRIICLRRGGRAILGQVLPKVFGNLLIALLLSNWLLQVILGAVARQAY